MQKYQYRVAQSDCSDDDDQEAELNALGAEGWELVAVRFDPSVFSHQATTYFLKRSYYDDE